MSFKTPLTEYELYVKVTDFFNPPQHLASTIFNHWLLYGANGKPFYKGWRWNNSHRHEYISCDIPPPLHDTGRMIYDPLINIPYIDKYQIILNRYDVTRHDEIAFSLHRIDAVLQIRRLAKNLTLQRKINWWIDNTINCTHYFEHYEDYQINKMVPDLWLSFAFEVGLSFRHARMSGYIPYVEEALDLMTERIRLSDMVDNMVIRYHEQNNREFIQALLLAEPIEEPEDSDNDMSFFDLI